MIGFEVGTFCLFVWFIWVLSGFFLVHVLLLLGSCFTHFHVIQRLDKHATRLAVAAFSDLSICNFMVINSLNEINYFTGTMHVYGCVT